MAVEIDVVYEGNLGCRATHGPSGAVIMTSPPVDNGGDGSKFSPTDLVGAALGCCLLTIMALWATNRGIELKGTTAHVEKNMATEGPRRIKYLPVTVRVPLDLDEKSRTSLEAAARACPVHKSLGEDVDAPIEFIWNAQ
ncbi:MAG: OsmC family protein [Planctomycetes bacterium]|nr:OsmC family protein [Planctomycetota bacterium]